MSMATAESGRLRDSLSDHRIALDAVLARYGATNPRLFGSVARGDATGASDVDIIVDLDEVGGNALLRVAGIGEELSTLLGRRVDVVSPRLLREEVSATVLRDAVAL